MIVALRDAWYRNPDWRLGQLVVNASPHRGDPFYIEDDTMLEGLAEIATKED